MANITFDSKPVTTVGELPTVGTKAPDFVLVDNDLNEIKLSDYAGKRVLLSIFPSVQTGVCAIALRNFNKAAAELDDAVVINVSKDLPFAFANFCAAEGIDKVVAASAFRSSFGEDYGATMADGPLMGLLSRAVVVLDGDGVVLYTQQVPEIGTEPNYDEAIKAIKQA